MKPGQRDLTQIVSCLGCDWRGDAGHRHNGDMGKRRKVRERLKELSHKELKAQVPREEPDGVPDTREKGSFAYGYCKKCDWEGAARRARDKARRDALEHAELCSGKHKPRIATTDTKS